MQRFKLAYIVIGKLYRSVGIVSCACASIITDTSHGIIEEDA
jgi:hypothetical protein